MKKGDKVKCINNDKQLIGHVSSKLYMYDHPLTFGKLYYIVEDVYDIISIRVTDDNGYPTFYHIERFLPVYASINENIKIL